jgi:hypothetical protein
MSNEDLFLLMPDMYGRLHSAGERRRRRMMRKKGEEEEEEPRRSRERRRVHTRYRLTVTKN